MSDRACERCGKPLDGKRAGARFCGSTCRARQSERVASTSARKRSPAPQTGLAGPEPEKPSLEEIARLPWPARDVEAARFYGHTLADTRFTDIPVVEHGFPR